MVDSTTPGEVPPSTRGVGDPRQFTVGLIDDVAKALEAHGYGPFDGPQLTELNLHLLHFLHGGGDRCNGRSAVIAPPVAPASPDSEPTRAERARVDDARARVARTTATRRDSPGTVDAARAREDEGRGLGL